MSIILFAKSSQSIPVIAQLHCCFWILAFNFYLFIYLWQSECAQLRGNNTDRLCGALPKKLQGQIYKTTRSLDEASWLQVLKAQSDRIDFVHLGSNQAINLERSHMPHGQCSSGQGKA